MAKTVIQLTLVAGILGLMTAGARAEIASSPQWGSLSGSLGFTTDYVFRGQTQNRGNPAFQGSLTYTHPTGAYVGLWASNVRLAPGDTAKAELDVSAGITNSIRRFSYDIGFISYLYPDSAGFAHDDYYEFYGKAGYDIGFVQLRAGLNGSPNYAGSTGGTIYYNANLNVPLPMLPYNAALSATAGYLTYFDNQKKNGADDYWDWSAGVSFTWKAITADFRYYATDLPEISPFTVDTANGRFVFSLTKTF